jgi:cellulose synthase operon protein C
MVVCVTEVNYTVCQATLRPFENGAMRSWRGVARLLACGLGACCGFLWLSALLGAERCQAFLDGLRDPRRGYYDVARDYLEQMRTSPLADPEFREAIDYHLGVTLLESSRRQPLAQREKTLEEAHDYFRKFLNDHPLDALETSARRNLADLLIERGRIKRELADQCGAKSDDRARLLGEAREIFKDARAALTEVDVRLNKMQRAIKPLGPNDEDAIRKRDRMRTEIILTRFSLAKMLYEIADTYEPGSKESRKWLKDAVAAFGEYYLKYEPRLGAYPFYIEEARCYKELGAYTKALVILNDLTSPELRNDAAFLPIRAAATELAMEVYLALGPKRCQDAWNAYDNWEKTVAMAEASEDARRNTAAVKYLGGEAALELVRSLSEKKPNEADLRAEYLQRAKELLTLAASVPGKYRLKARFKLTDPLLAGGEARVETPKDTADARDRAQLAWDQLQERGLSRERTDRLRAEARVCFRYVLAHPPQKATVADLNAVRYCLAYLDWMAGDYYDAAVLGEFLARRYADQPMALRGAEVALKAYAKLCFDGSAGDDRQFETDRMTAMAEWITDRWPKSSVADDARIMQIRAAMSRRNPNQAVRYLAKISETSPRRGDAELLTGRLLWDACGAAMRLPEDQQPTKATLSMMVAEGHKALESGIKRLREGVNARHPVSPTLAAAVLTLAQICLYQAEPEEALAWLDDPKIGPNTLAKAKHKATSSGDFGLQAFETALRAYTAVGRWDKAAETLDALHRAGGAAKGARMYLTVGRQLEAAWRRLLADDNQAETAKAARGFEFLLTQIAALPAGEIGFPALLWAADALVALGDSMDSGDGKLSAEASADYRKAVRVYEKIVETCRADGRFAPRPDAVLSVQIRLARCLRRLGRFDEAMEVLATILKSRENLLDAQREAAYTYQAWGDESADHLLSAILGGYKVQREDGGAGNLVWGWNRIARRVQPFEGKSYQDQFNEARYNLALCRLKYALSQAGDQRVAQLQRAEQDILVILRIRPSMGGPEWYDRYDALLKKIQGLLGVKESERGLKAAEQKMPSAAQ